MTREEAIWWVNPLFEIRKEEYFNKGMMEDAKEVEEAQHMAIEALSADTVSREKYDKVNDLYLMSIKALMNKPVIVRCKDCRYLDREDNYCTDGGGLVIGVTENDFCSRAERREPSKVDYRTDESANIGTEVNDLIKRKEVINYARKCADGYSYIELPIDAFVDGINALPSADIESDDLIIKGAKGIQDGLYNITDGKLFKNKANGGTVRTYPIVTIDYAPTPFTIKTTSADTAPIEQYRELQHCYVILAATFAEYLQKEKTK